MHTLRGAFVVIALVATTLDGGCLLFAAGDPCVSNANCGPHAFCNANGICARSSEGEGEGEGEGTPIGEGEGEGEGTSIGEGEGEGTSIGEGEGEGTSIGEGEGEGGGEGEGEGEGADGSLVEYSFDGTALDAVTGTTGVIDRSGNHHTLVVEDPGASFVDDVLLDGSAMRLGPSFAPTGEADIGADSIATSSFTVSFCLDNVVPQAARDMPFQMGGTGPSDPGIDAEFGRNPWQFDIVDGAQNELVLPIALQPLIAAHCYAAVVDRPNGIATGFVDGALVSKRVINFGVITAGQRLSIGGNLDTTNPIDATIDDFVVFPFALPDSEVRVRHSFTQLQQGLFARYGFDTPGPGPTVVDESGSGRDATTFGSSEFLDFAIQGTSYVIDANATDAGFTAGQDTLLAPGAPFSIAFLFSAFSMFPGDVRDVLSISNGFGLAVLEEGFDASNVEIILRLNGAAGLRDVLLDTIPNSSPHAFAIVFDGQHTLSLFVDGQTSDLLTIDLDGAPAIGDISNPGGLVVGSSALPFVGAIDDIRLYDRTLSADEVATLANVAH